MNEVDDKADEVLETARSEAKELIRVARIQAKNLRGEQVDTLDLLRQDFKDHAELDEKNFLELKKEINDGLANISVHLKKMGDAIDPLSDAYNGILFSKKFIVGVSSVVIALAAIGAGVIWVVNSAITK